MQFFPFVFTLFMFILIGNMLGMIPGTFTFTSHIIVTFAMALVVFIGVTIIGFVARRAFPAVLRADGRAEGDAAAAGADRGHVLLTRPISLSVRLFANMMAGHTMLKVFAGFIVSLGLAGPAWRRSRSWWR